MNSSYAIAGAFLTVLFVMMTVSMAGNAIFYAPAPESEGFEIAALETSAPTEATAEEEGLPPIAPLLVNASADGGMRAFRKCAACHTVENGGANRVGPNLWDIIDRPVAAATGFGYSNAMNEFADGGQIQWDYEHLNAFLAAPRSYVRGTSMSFAGIRSEKERADIIAYLRAQSDSPVALPSPDAASGGDGGESGTTPSE